MCVASFSRIFETRVQFVWCCGTRRRCIVLLCIKWICMILHVDFLRGRDIVLQVGCADAGTPCYATPCYAVLYYAALILRCHAMPCLATRLPSPPFYALSCPQNTSVKSPSRPITSQANQPSSASGNHCLIPRSSTLGPTGLTRYPSLPASCALSRSCGLSWPVTMNTTLLGHSFSFSSARI